MTPSNDESPAKTITVPDAGSGTLDWRKMRPMPPLLEVKFRLSA